VEHGAVAKIVGNLCKGNKTAGIGIRKRAEATVTNNRILDNGSVAIGVRNGSKIIADKNTLSRKGGMPPLIAILDNSQATLIDNDLSGGGVAGVLLQGNATVKKNRFHGNGPRKGGPPNFAIWVREGSEITFSDNQVKGWRHALFASEAKQVTASDNQVRAFLGTALVIRDSEKPATATGNRAFSDDPKAQAIEISGPSAKVTGNRVEKSTRKIN
jgi:nitrous oxidase accessory protein NosD